MRRSGLAAIVVGMLVAASPASAGTLDQQQTSSGNGGQTYGGDNFTAQTFTAGLSGGLDQVDLGLDECFIIGGPSGVPTPVTVEIRTVSGGQPTNTVLATSGVTVEARNTYEVIFATPARVSAGTPYAIVLSAPRFCNAIATVGDPYPRGAVATRFGSSGDWSFAARDLVFRTYVLISTCKGEPATVPGTPGADELKGTSGRDVIAGLGGKDEISGLGGKDLICGGKGKDTLRGGKAKDKLYGQKGKDKLSGGGGRDRCVGGKKDDSAKKCEVEKSI